MSLPSLTAARNVVVANLISLFCGKVRKNPLRRKNKSRCRNASLTVEAAFVFPIFFFSVFYLLQMFTVLRSELTIAEAGIASARDAAAFAYVTERFEGGEIVAAKKLFELFDKKLVRDAAFTTVFYERCDEKLLNYAGVAQGLGGMWVESQKGEGTVRLQVRYRVRPPNPLFPDRTEYYYSNLVYREWTGTGKISKQKLPGTAEEPKEQVVYLAENATVYHWYKDCTYIHIKTSAVNGNKIDSERNANGARYYACEFCEPVISKNSMVYITKYGTRYHAVSTCPAIERKPGECSLEEAQKKYGECMKCSARKEKEGE